MNRIRLVVLAGILLAMGFLPDNASCQDFSQRPAPVQSADQYPILMQALANAVIAGDFELALATQSDAALLMEARFQSDPQLKTKLESEYLRHSYLLIANGQFEETRKLYDRRHRMMLDDMHELLRSHYQLTIKKETDDIAVLEGLSTTEAAAFVKIWREYFDAVEMAGSKARNMDADSYRKQVKQFIAEFTRLLGVEHHLTWRARNTLAFFLIDKTKDGESAIRNFKELARSYSTQLGPTHQRTLFCEYNVGRAYWRANQPLEAERWIKKAADTYRESIGLRSIRAGEFHQSAARIQINNGKPNAALVYFYRALEAFENSVDSNPEPYAAGVLSNLANTYSDLRNNNLSMEFAKKAHDALARAKPVLINQTKLAMAKLSLGQCLVDRGDYAEALTLFDEFLELHKKLPNNNERYSTLIYVECLHQRARALRGLKQLEEAYQSMELAITTFQEATRTDSEDSSDATSARIAGYELIKAYIVADMEKHQEALAILESAGQRLEKSNSISFLLKGHFSKTIGDELLATNQPEKARNAYLRSLEQYYHDLLKQQLTLTATELVSVNSYARKSLGRLVGTTDLKNPRELAELYQHLTRYKGMSSRLVKARIAAIREKNRSGAALQRYSETSRSLSGMILAVSAGNFEKLPELKDLELKKAAGMGELVGDIRISDVLKDPDLAEIAGVLDANTAIIDIRRVESTWPEHSISYLAFVLTVDTGGLEIQAVPLGDAVNIDFQILAYVRGFVPENRRGLEPIGKKWVSPASARQFLSKSVWKPIASAIGNRKRILVCPENVFSTLPWASLPGSQEDHYLIEDGYVFVQQISPATILELNQSHQAFQAKRKKAIFIGGLEYGDPHSSQRFAWNNLDNTGPEIDTIREMLPNEMDHTAITGEAAIESRILDELASANVAHFATHGFGYRELHRLTDTGLNNEQKQTLDAIIGQHPFSSFGLVLSLANQHVPTLVGDTRTTAGHISHHKTRDCWLTGEDLLYVDMSNMELAVLSACSSGGGFAAHDEGVFGIQRAFHLAGTRVSLASMWDVDDRRTKELMVLFYNNLFVRELSPVDALHQAQLELMKQPGVSPADWAAWSITGDWR